MGMYEGSAAELPGNVLNALPNVDDLKLFFADYDLPPEMLKQIKNVCAEHFSELQLLGRSLDVHRLQPANWVIDVKHVFASSFFARVGGAKGKYQICMSLGVPLVALSVAEELCTLESNQQSSSLDSRYANRENSVNNWFVGLHSLSKVSPGSVQLALDVAVLLYCHEVAHAIFGHCDYIPSNDNERRALEHDADFNAGAMFALWVQVLPSSTRKSSSSKMIFKRLARSGYLLSVILKEVSSSSKKYHLPTSRLEAFLSGGVFAMAKSKRAPSFSSDLMADKYWHDFYHDQVKEIREAVSRSSLREHYEFEKDLSADRAAVFKCTAVVRDRLKDGPLTLHRLNISR
ncbi:conserved protein of unknown function [Pseudomonas sp. JV551A1]|uniref:Uncharacterized protein n=1 Tax=Pseudomonas inefficax TaxID=2078786 RepID=A0AAQ1ST02_9PSED|nr:MULTISPECIES: hypothetical protein [Pseudomonas]SPO54120.1 conserved protein of unknown function [Pseudomonas sp. JV551A1]SPO60402.1 conserved protein of unknown function [Pseudomonas inefficax]